MKPFVSSLLLSSSVIVGMAGCSGAAKQSAQQTFLDVHEFGPGKVTAADVAAAHEKDLRVQSQFGVRFARYWVDEEQGKVFCLSTAPNAEAVRETHRHAHGLLPDTITRVTEGK